MKKLVPNFEEFLNEGNKNLKEAEKVLHDLEMITKKFVKAAQAAAKKEGFKELDDYFEAVSAGKQTIRTIEKQLIKIDDACAEAAEKYARKEDRESLHTTLYSAIVEGGANSTILGEIHNNLWFEKDNFNLKK